MTLNSNAAKLKFLADTVVLASEDLTKNRVPIAHALLQKGLDAVGTIAGLDENGERQEDRLEFESVMAARGYPASEFDSFLAEGEHTYYSKVANCMYSAWLAAKAV